MKEKPLAKKRAGPRSAPILNSQEEAARLARENVAFVYYVAKPYLRNRRDGDDVIQAGMVGLMLAAQRFDASRGFRFGTYASHWIRQRIRVYLLEEAEIVRVPKGTIDRGRAAPIRNEDLVQLDDSAETSWGGFLAKTLLCPSAGMSGREARDLALAEEEARRAVARLLEHLDRRTARVVTAYFGLDGRGECTLEEIGSLLGISRERVRQLLNQAMAILRWKVGIGRNPMKNARRRQVLAGIAATSWKRQAPQAPRRRAWEVRLARGPSLEFEKAVGQ